MQPWPTAYTFFHRSGQLPVRVILHRAALFENWEDETPSPGTIDVNPHRPERLLVWTSNGLVEVLELQPAGKRRMTAAEFLRGHRPKPGDRFGPETP
jgi:methionyl-tRNA formyltransferase